jgi:hypothetical protein
MAGAQSGLPISPDGTNARFYRSSAYLACVTKTVLPLFPARNVKLIFNAVCDKTVVGLRARVLVPVQPSADAR